ncbi:acetyl-CoA hydrolase/transferase family protein [Chitinophaga silvatica]|uniref:Acetyl-CoA hydrolase/transferase family protein n=1 Tax=Chitinophaga silvatica TaxID=2282649 RepID=A0A3E1YB72_9BACT|nr:acetyl-CoA hydrolase/transferase C-terminal domain-containing protein [Chitinophaga silvatica]RFS23260.1 acetyl-CoA hydrolase/transferase family protein [Chitinophaga silvatica]
MAYTSIAAAVSLIQSGHTVFIHTAAATPRELVYAMSDRYKELKNVRLVSIHTEWDAPYADPERYKSFQIDAFFVGKNVRQAVNEGRANYVPMFLSEIPRYFRTCNPGVDVALISVSPPDKNGYCTLGVSCDVSKAAVDTAKIIIAEVNPRMPTVLGDGVIHISKITAAVEVDYPIYSQPVKTPSHIDLSIGRHVASLIEDGATLQMGIGGIPNAVLESLHQHKDLGIHTEMFSDGIVDLVEKGVITGKHKKVHPGLLISSFAIGSQRLYKFMDTNLLMRLMDVGYVNDPSIIRKNPKVTAINSAIEIDIFGQVCADSIGFRQYSGVGGQMDFMRGAALSENGKPIIALPSVTSKGNSRIVAQLLPGASVVTTRAHVHYVVTEYGIAYLHGKNLKQRARALINIAHPDHRNKLEKDAFEIFKSF